MAYEKTNWTSTTPINATNLNKIENGIETNNINIGNLSTLNTTEKTNLVGAINEVNNKFNYSTEERAIGTWINNKPVYRKVIDCGVLPNATTKNIDLGFNINTVIILKCDMFTYNPSANWCQPVPNGNKDSQISFEMSGSNLVISTGSNRTSYTQTYAIMEYAKITD